MAEEKIDHVAEALALIEKYMKGGPSAEVVAAAIGAHATLALAEQQRIANLIALAAYADDRFGDNSEGAGGMSTLVELSPGGFIVLREEIRKGLGL